MYSYEWDRKTRGFKLTTKTGKFVASEIRPVFAEELLLLGFDEHFQFERNTQAPLMWAKNNVYFYNGEEVAKVHKVQMGTPVDKEYLVKPCKLKPVDIPGMLRQNKIIMDSLIANTSKLVKKLYDDNIPSCDIAYIGYSGGKDSVVLLDFCDKVLPPECPVIFSDTTMELPDTYEVWAKTIESLKQSQRGYFKISNQIPAIDNWYTFGPPSRSIRWCCSIHKSSPVSIFLRQSGLSKYKRTLAFVGVRSDESLARSHYSEVGNGVKNASQINAMPLLDWGSHEIYLYIFMHDLPLNRAYRLGLPRVGCIMCPEASDKYAWYVNAIYPEYVKPYEEAIVKTSAKIFSSGEDSRQFVSSSGWQARKSGVTLSEFIVRPSEVIRNNTIEWCTTPIDFGALKEWIKTLGFLQRDDSGNNILYCRGVLSSVGEVKIDFVQENEKIVKISCQLQSSKDVRDFRYPMRKVVQKALACIACSACEAECPFAALRCSYGQRIEIDDSKCKNCLKCHDIDDGCWRFTSMEISKDTNAALVGIDRYKHFGLKKEWVALYADEKEGLFSSVALGPNMIPAARNWFSHAFLSTGQGDHPSKLLQVAEAQGADSELLWDLLWIGLAQKSALIKWFVVNCKIDTLYSIDDLQGMLGELKESTKNGGLDSLKATFRQSPLGTGSAPVVEMVQKGVRVLGLKRVPKSIEPLAVLYSLYLMATVADRTAFTLSEMMTADFESPYISPLVAFGMNVEELKGQCMGISSIYPDYLACSFTLGLEEIKVFPKEKTLDDVIGLILGE